MALYSRLEALPGHHGRLLGGYPRQWHRPPTRNSDAGFSKPFSEGKLRPVTVSGQHFVAPHEISSETWLRSKRCSASCSLSGFAPRFCASLVR